jgi:L-glyceraldehyde 3-phosphate reductase
VAQLSNSLQALDYLEFSEEKLNKIDRYAVDAGINIWNLDT